MSALVSVAQLRHRLVLEQAVDAPDGAGGAARSWGEVATLWAALEAVAARSSFAADSGGVRITHRITIRHRVGLSTRHRFRHGTRVFEIRSFSDPHADGRFLVAETQEMVP